MTSLPRLAVAALAAVPLAASFSLFGAVARGETPAVATPAVAAAFDLREAEIQACRHRTGRDYADCEDETEGKALVRDAELALATLPPQPGAAARPSLQ